MYLGGVIVWGFMFHGVHTILEEFEQGFGGSSSITIQGPQGNTISSYFDSHSRLFRPEARSMKHVQSLVANSSHVVLRHGLGVGGPGFEGLRV